MSDLRVGSVFGKAHHQNHGAMYDMIDFIRTLEQGGWPLGQAAASGRPISRLIPWGGV